MSHSIRCLRNFTLKRDNLQLQVIASIKKLLIYLCRPNWAYKIV